MSKPQLLHIHGGMTCLNEEKYVDYLKTRSVSIEKKKKWTKDYVKQLENEIYPIQPVMPLKENARYKDWKLHFEKYFEFLEENVVLVGYSLGRIFLAKYLSENKFPANMISLYLIAPPYDDTIEGEDLVGGFELGDDLSLIEEQCKHITLMFSDSDEIIPIEHSKKYFDALPLAKLILYSDKNGHFNDEEFPELVEMIKEDLKRISNP